MEERLTQGNPTDGAILRFAEGATPSDSVRSTHPQITQVTFNSKNKFALTCHNESQSAEKSSCLVLVKGAPDVLISKCTSYLSHADGSVRPFDAAAHQRFSELQTRLSRNAERVLMFCQRTYSTVGSPTDKGFEQELLDNAMSDLTIIGVVGIFDPPRPELSLIHI